jgi:hypothetical protein
VRAWYLPVRLAATVMAVAAATGCMRVGGDGLTPGPPHSARQHGGAEPDGGSAVTGGGIPGHQGGHDTAGTPAGRDGSAAASVSPSASGTPEPSSKASSEEGKDRHKRDKPQIPDPAMSQPTPTRTEEQPPPTREPESPAPEPSTAEPSSSAHQQGTRLAEREPAPRVGGAA